MCENQTWSMFFTLHWGNSLADTCDRNVPDDISVVFSTPSWGCQSSSSIINLPQGAPDPRSHWPVNSQLPLIGLLIGKVTARIPQMLTSNLRGSSSFKTRRALVHKRAGRIHSRAQKNRCERSRTKVELHCWNTFQINGVRLILYAFIMSVCQFWTVKALGEGLISFLKLEF